MCARFTLIAPHEVLAEQFDVEFPDDLSPRANIAPTQPVLMVRESGGQREVAEATWGLIPFWADDPAIATRLINARSETALEKGSFKHAMERRRCLIPASGFFEWETVQEGGKKVKQPLVFRRPDGRPLALAGLWERWKDPAGPVRETCTILTTAPNALLAQIHDRMPCLIGADDYEAWLSPEVPKEASATLLRTAPDDALIGIPVSRAMNHVRVEDPSLLAEAFA